MNPGPKLRVFRTVRHLALIAVLIWPFSTAAEVISKHPLEPPDRSSPRATLSTFLDSIDEAWEIYSRHDPGFRKPFTTALECLNLSQVPPLVFDQVASNSALYLKEVLDRIELPPLDEIPDAAAVAEAALEKWTVPHTEITLVLATEGDRQGEWLFSARTVANVDEFYARVAQLPYQPGRLGGHVQELRGGSRAALLLKLAELMPPWFKSEIGDMLVWQWFGLALLVMLLAAGVAASAWIGRRLRRSTRVVHRFAPFLLPLALVSVPFVSRVFLARLFQLPGTPALMLRLFCSVIGYVGLMWLVALVLIRFGEVIVRFWFRDARPLKQQLVRVVFRIATIIVVTAIGLKAAQSLGVPVAGLIAGLGVGGLAIALAAQSTLENFIGGIILYADQPVKVGDMCYFGNNRRGVVEDVGLRSVKIRTLDRTVVSIPNADFAKLHLENLADRDRVLLRENLRLPLETPHEQLQGLMADLESMLRTHEQLADAPLRVRFMSIGEYFLEVEIYAYAMTDSWPDFLEIREDVLLKVLDIVERSGTRLTLPAEFRYVGEQRTIENP